MSRYVAAAAAVLAAASLQAQYPPGCGDAASASASLRARDASRDPARLHAAIAAYRACADGPYGSAWPGLYNTAIFSAAAAALLAGRLESGRPSIADARFARHASQLIIDYRHSPRRLGPRDENYAPSPYVTDAERIHDAASAMIETART